MNEIPQIIAGLGDIAEQYDALLCDVWGVVHDGYTAFDASIAALQRFRQERGPVVLITNSPRPSSEIPAQFAQIGVRMDCQDAIVTSGEVTRAELRARAPGPVYIVGPDRDLPLYEGMGLDTAPLEEAAFVSCTGLFDDFSETPDMYLGLLRRMLARDLVMVCANPDIVVMVGDRKIWCSGALAQIYTKMGGKVVMAGKPYAPIYDICLAEVSRLAGREVPKSRILAIGDGMGTDVKGAEAHGLDCLFVATGIHRNAVSETGQLDAGQLAADLAQEKTRARYGAPGLIW